MGRDSRTIDSPRAERGRDWSAEWIWSPAEAAAPNSFYHFRREFDAGSADEILIHVTADTHCRLFVDGERVGRGPPDGLPLHKYYDTHRVSLDDREGPHCVAVLANYHDRMAGTRGGLLLEVVAGESSETVLAATDDTWPVTSADAWRRDTYYYRPNRHFPYQEWRDMRRLPGGWTETGFDDDHWDSADSIGHPPTAGPWTRLVPRDIPEMAITPQSPAAIEDTHETLRLPNRQWEGDPPDISTELSRSGQPVDRTLLNGVAHLCRDDAAETTTVQSSTEHESDPTVDGVYDPCVVLDFGRVVTGYFEFEVEGVDGATVDVGFAERLVDGAFNNDLDGRFSDRFVLRDGEQTVRTFAWRSFRYVKIRFGKCYDPVEVESVRAQLTGYPYEEQGGFVSDDETMNEVFDICQYTIRLCSHEAIVDTPWREQAQWLGDVSAVILGGVYSCFGDTALPSKFVRLSASNQLVTGLLNNVTNETSTGEGAVWNWENSMLDYSLWWVTALWNHYEYTGEEAWIRDFYPHARRVIQAVEPFLTDDGVVGPVPYAVFVDQAKVETGGASSVVTALFYAAVGAVERMADLVGDEYTADQMASYRDGIESGFQSAFYDSGRECVVDCVVNGEQSDSVSEHANAVALRWGLLDEEVAETVVDTLYEAESVDYTEAAPFFTFVVLRGLKTVGRMDLALEIIRDRWGERLVEQGFQTTPEEWTINGSRRSGAWGACHRSLSHAWSAGPAQFLIHDLTGFEILDPGCESVGFDPTATAFEYDIDVPTPRGTISVTHRDGSVEVNAPEDVALDVPADVSVTSRDDG